MRILRTLLFTALIGLTLTAVSYLIYFAPAQLERRAAEGLAPYLAVPPWVSGARQGWMGPLTMERLQVRASPVIDQRDLLVLYDLQVEAGEEDWAEMGLLAPRPGEGLAIRARRGELFLDHEESPDPKNTVFSRSVWNFRDVWRGEEALAAAARGAHRLTIDELNLVVGEVRRRQEKVSWGATVEDFTVEPAAAGTLLVRGDLTPGPYWSEGHFQVRLTPEATAEKPILEAQGSLDDLHGLDEWVGLVFPAYGRLQTLLAPRGAVVLTLASFRLFRPSAPPAPPSRAAAGPGDPPAGSDPPRGKEPPDLLSGRAEYQGSVRHYDTTVRFSGGLEARHLSGVFLLDPGQVTLGAALLGPEREGGEDRVTAEIWGSEVEIRGRVAPSASDLRLEVPKTDLGKVAANALPGWLGSLWRRLRPSGALSSELDLHFGAGAGAAFDGVVSFSDLAFEELPFLGPITGSASLRAEGERGSGTIAIAGGRSEPLGSFSGEIPVVFGPGEVTLEPTQLLLGGGRCFGKLVLAPATGSISGRLRWEGSSLDYSGGLLTASRVGGKLDLSGSEGKLSGAVSFDLGGVTIRGDQLPHGDFPLGEGETLAFGEGELTAVLGVEAIRPLELALRGERCGLRLLGSIGYRGGLDAVAVLAVGEPAQLLNRLGPGSTPAQWRRAVGDRGLALRVRGDPQRLRIRRVEWSDPSFHGPGDRDLPTAPPRPPEVPAARP
jgi:hypothetical protein